MYIMHLDSNSINYMFNSSFKQIEDFTYPVLPETCCLGRHLECGCLRLRFWCRLVNSLYRFLSAVSVFIGCVRKII